MKYKIINYFPDKFQIFFKAAETEEEMEFSQIFPMSILRTPDVDSLKAAMHYVWFFNNKQQQLQQLNPDVEGFVRANVNTLLDIDVTADPDAQISHSNADSVGAQTTATIV